MRIDGAPEVGIDIYQEKGLTLIKEWQGRHPSTTKPRADLC